MPFTLPKTEGRPVTIIGGGVLGRRIATVWASGGHDVNIRDPAEDQRQAAEKYVRENVELYSRSTRRKPGKVEVHEDLASSVKDAWLVIECVPEKKSLKIDTFAELEKTAPEDAILVSNSSSYKSSELVEKVCGETKQRIANMHYYMPPTSMIVELMTCGSTDPSIFPFLVEELKKCSAVPFVAKKDSTGLIFNRIWAAIKREVIMVISEGVATPEDIDSLWKLQFRSPLGPVEWMDNVGLDTVSFIEQHYIEERGLPSEHTVNFLEKNYISQGRLGTKSEKGGFYPKDKHPEANKHDEPTLYYLDIGAFAPNDPLHGGRVLSSSADGKTTNVLVENQPLPDGVDVGTDATGNKRLYWTNMNIPSHNNGSVMSCKLDGKDVQTIVPEGGVHTPKQLIVDQKNQKLYFSDREGMRVMRCGLDGSGLEVLVKTGDFESPQHAEDSTRWCVGIAVDAEQGVVYWTQKGPSKANKGRIFRAGLEFKPGETAENRSDIELLFDKLPEPIDLELHDGYLYWTDRGEVPLGNSINRVSLNDIKTGSASEHKHQVISRNLHEAIGLKIDSKNNYIYATDIGGALYRCELDGKNRVKLRDDEAAYTGITLSYP